jgi:starch-binding outer membrane protein SusE/F
LSAKSMKFRANNGWDINLGGNLSGLTYGGDNISISEAGNYKIVLDLSNPLKYKATITKL